MKFEWNSAKADSNEAKHNVSFDEASTVFGDDLSITGRDLEHSIGESRLVTFGLSSRRKLLAVSHTERGSIIRIISARAATRKEKRLYEEA